MEWCFPLLKYKSHHNHCLCHLCISLAMDLRHHLHYHNYLHIRHEHHLHHCLCHKFPIDSQMCKFEILRHSHIVFAQVSNLLDLHIGIALPSHIHYSIFAECHISHKKRLCYTIQLSHNLKSRQHIALHSYMLLFRTFHIADQTYLEVATLQVQSA